MPAAMCPPADLISRYLDDRLPDNDSVELESHLSSCPTCEDRLRQALKGDPLLPLARSGPGTAWSVPVVLRNQLLGLCAVTDTNGTGTHDTAPAPAVRAPELSGVLRPAQAPDELGRLGEYRILKVLGKGGMGVVCLGEDLRLQRFVAVKVIRPGMATDPRAAAWFFREARALAALSHEHVVTVFQGGQDGDTLFLAMELLEGQTVAAWMNENPRRRLGEVLRTAREAAEGLAYAHSKGVVHRDFKPANLWRTTDRGRIKLLDFGLARRAENETLTTPGQVMGTPAYMSPEQGRGAAVDHRTDLFSLGAVMYELCAGTSPFARTSQVDSLVAVAEHHPDPLSRWHPWFPAELVELIEKLLAKDPAARVQTADEVVEALRRLEAQTGPEVLGRTAGIPDPRAEPAPATTRPLRRWAWIGIGGAAALLLIVAGLGFALSGRNGGAPAGSAPPVEPPGANPGNNEDPQKVAPPPPPSIKVQPGDPLSADAMTQKPKGYQGLSYTLDTTHHRKPIYSFAFQPRGTLFAAASKDGTVRVYDTKTWKFVKAIVLPSQTTHGPANCLWTPDGQRLITESGRVIVWDLETARPVYEAAHPSRSAPGSVAVSSDGEFLAYGWRKNPGGSVVSVRVESLKTAGSGTELVHDGVPDALSWKPTGPDQKRVLAVGYQTGAIRLWEIGGKGESTLDMRGKPMKGVSWSPDGKRLASFHGNATGMVSVWSDGKPTTLGAGAAAQASAFAWSPTGDSIVTSTATGLRFYDLARADPTVQEVRIGNVGAVAWAPDGKRLAVVGPNKEVRFVDRTGKVLHTIEMFENPKTNGESFIAPKAPNAFVCVVQTKDGQQTLTPDEFAKRTGWKNKPEDVIIP